jgi:membrane protein
MRMLLRPKTLLTLLETAFSEWSTHNVPRMSAALAYYTIFSLAPVLIVAIAIARMAFGEKAAQGTVIAEIQNFIGQDSARAIQTMIQSAHKPAHSAIASVVGLVVLLTRKIRDFRSAKGLAMVQNRCLCGFETKSEAFA